MNIDNKEHDTQDQNDRLETEEKLDRRDHRELKSQD